MYLAEIVHIIRRWYALWKICLRGPAIGLWRVKRVQRAHRQCTARSQFGGMVGGQVRKTHSNTYFISVHCGWTVIIWDCRGNMCLIHEVSAPHTSLFTVSARLEPACSFFVILHAWAPCLGMWDRPNHHFNSGPLCVYTWSRGCKPIPFTRLHDNQKSFLWHPLAKDGMDQAKWSIPRHKSSTTPKSMASLVRPKFKVQGTWVHGVLLKLWVLDPRCPADASMVVETMLRSIEQVIEICETKGIEPPDELLCWVPCCKNCICYHIGHWKVLSKFYSDRLTDTKIIKHWSCWSYNFRQIIVCRCFTLRRTIVQERTRTTRFFAASPTWPQPKRWECAHWTSDVEDIHMGRSALWLH